MIEVLKAIEHTYNRHSLAIFGVVPHLCQYIAYSIISTIRKGKKILMSDKSNKQTKMDALQALLIAENSISGAITSDRILVTRLALQFCQSRILKQDEITALLSSIKRLVMISDIRMKIEKFSLKIAEAKKKNKKKLGLNAEKLRKLEPQQKQRVLIKKKCMIK